MWGDKLENIRQLQEYSRKTPLPAFTTVVSAKDLQLTTSLAQQLDYVQTHRMELLQKMQDHAAVIFRDFDLMKTPDGFQQFYQALQMKPCLDPLHSVSARPTVDGTKNSPVYEAVNKESRKNFFIGTTLVCVFCVCERSDLVYLFPLTFLTLSLVNIISYCY